MDLEAAPCDASSSLCSQKKRKKLKKRHNSMENNHTDHGHREGSSSRENRPLGSDSPQEPPDNSSAKLDLEAQLDSDVKRSEKNKGRNKHEKRRYSLKDKALGYGASEEGTSLKNLSTEQKSAVNTHLNLEKTEPSAEVGSSHKKTNKGKRWKRRHNDFKINGTDHDLREGGHVPSTDLTIINHSEKADVSFISYPSSIKNHDDKDDDDAALLEMKNDVNINKRKTKIKTYGRRKTRFSNSSESNLESIKEDGNKVARLRVEDGTSVHPLKDIAMEAAFVNCSDSKPTSEKRKKNMVSNLKDATDETSFVKMPVIPAGNSEPVNGVQLDKMKVALQDEAENMEEETEVKEIIPSSSHLGAIKDDVKIVNKEENPPHTSQSLPERAVSCHSRKKLLILDVNGLLADIVPYFVEGYKPDIVVSRKSVFKRPFCDDFLQFCFERFDVGVWSSRTKKNVDMVLEFLMADARHKLLFCWIKPVRDSMTEALQLWKKVAGKGDGVSDDQKTTSNDGENSEPAEFSDKNGPKVSNPGERKAEALGKDSSNGSSPANDSVSKTKGGSIPDKAVGILKKKVPAALTDKELNPEFFQKLETRGSDDLPVEVVVPRRCLNSANSHNEEESEQNDADLRGRSNLMEPDDVHGSVNIKYRNAERGNAGLFSKQRDFDEVARDKWADERVNGKDSRTRAFDIDDRIDINQRESSGSRVGFSKTDVQSEGSFMNNKGNWLAIQRQLLQLERQQAHLMNMLQDFMGGSHDSMVTLENRVRGLERVVEDMARDLSISSGRRGGNFMVGFEGSSNRSLGKYNGYPDYSSAKLGRGSDGRIPFGERFGPSDGIASGMRGRGPPWRSDMAEAWDFPTYGAPKNGQMGSRRALVSGPVDGRSPKAEHESDQVGNRRAWDKGAAPVRFGEGPSARSVWQASKDEATLEAIRVAGEDSGATRTARVAMPELTAEAMGDDNVVPERDPVWTSWSNAMDALHVGDMDSAYAEVLSTGDDLLLVKLMDRSGPVLDQLSNDVASEILHAVGQFLLEQNLFDICLSWIQQLVDVVMENGPDIMGIPIEVKRELLLNLNEASATTDPPEDWEGATPDQLLLQLASAWGIDLQQLEK